MLNPLLCGSYGYMKMKLCRKLFKVEATAVSPFVEKTIFIKFMNLKSSKKKTLISFF